jgi:hypothetical protein
METGVIPVQNGRGRRQRWSAEQKLAVLQEWKNGVPLEEVCRKYAVNAAQPGAGAEGFRGVGPEEPSAGAVEARRRTGAGPWAKIAGGGRSKKNFELKGLKLPEGT